MWPARLGVRLCACLPLQVRLLSRSRHQSGANAITCDALICQERRTTFSVDELRNFTEEAAKQAGHVHAVDNPRKRDLPQVIAQSVHQDELEPHDGNAEERVDATRG